MIDSSKMNHIRTQEGMLHCVQNESDLPLCDSFSDFESSIEFCPRLMINYHRSYELTETRIFFVNIRMEYFLLCIYGQFAKRNIHSIEYHVIHDTESYLVQKGWVDALSPGHCSMSIEALASSTKCRALRRMHIFQGEDRLRKYALMFHFLSQDVNFVLIYMLSGCESIKNYEKSKHEILADINFE